MILIFQRCLVHYRAPILKLLHEDTGSIVCYGKQGPPICRHLVTEADFPHYNLRDWHPFPKHNEVAIQGVIAPIFKYKPKIVMIDPGLSILSNWVILLLKYIMGFKLILWGHGFNRKTGFDPKINFSDKVRLWWMNRADAVIAYSQEIKESFAQYVSNPKKIFLVQNTLDTHQLTVIRDELDTIGKEHVKNELGWNNKYNIIFTGRILEEKEPDRLVEVFKLLSDRIDSIALHFVGEGPFLDELKKKSEELNIEFWGRITDNHRVGKMLYASDLTVIPGYLGLSVVHAFCFDTPVVSQKKGDQGPYHSPEVEHVVDGKTGFLVEYGNNQAMADTIFNYLHSVQQQDMMKNEIRYTVEHNCTLEQMMNGFKKAIDYVNGVQSVDSKTEIEAGV